MVSVITDMNKIAIKDIINITIELVVFRLFEAGVSCIGHGTSPTEILGQPWRWTPLPISGLEPRMAEYIRPKIHTYNNDISLLI
jgi:hypothetical protein